MLRRHAKYRVTQLISVLEENPFLLQPTLSNHCYCFIVHNAVKIGSDAGTHIPYC